jgi:uncharacterized protein
MADDPSLAQPRRISRDALRRIYETTRTIAVVGASTKENRPAHYVPAYLAAQGYRVIGVSPRPGELFGEPVRATLDEIEVPVDVVDVFRPAEEGPQVARDAARIGARVIWFQPGTESEEAVRVASAAGLEVVTRWCMGMAHGTLGLGPGPDHDDD